MKFIDNIRNQPHHKRNQIIWICAGLVAALLLIVWAIVGNSNKSDNSDNFFNTFNNDFQTSKSTSTNPLQP